MDSNGFSDPYALLCLNGQKFKTRIVQKSLNPVWDAAFSYKLSAGPAILNIQVWDWDRASQDDFLGECNIDLRVIGENPKFDVPLSPEPGKAREQGYVKGTITLGVEITESGAAATVSSAVVSKMKERLKACMEKQDTSLDLSAFSLPGLPKIVVERLNFVKKLDLSLNKLAAFPDLSRFTLLEELDLTGNMLSALPEELGTATTLHVLSLNGNVLSSLPHSIGKLQNLEKLELNNNCLAELPKELGRLSNLQELLLSGNPLSALPDAMGALRNLVALDLSCCQLVQLPESLTLASRIINLNLGGNQLVKLPDGIGRMTRLVSLNVQDNQLRDLPVFVGLCTGLGQIGYGVNVARNPIADTEMIRQYKQGSDHLFDYLTKRHAFNGSLPVPPCAYPSDLGDGPLPLWLVTELERQKRMQEGQARTAAAASASVAGAQSSLPPASSGAMEQKLTTLRTWAQITVKDVLRPAFASYRSLVRSSADLKEMLDVSYRLANLNEEFAKVKDLVSFDSKSPGAPSADLSLLDLVRVYTLAAINYVELGVRTVLTSLENATVQQIASVVQFVQVLNKVKTALQ